MGRREKFWGMKVRLLSGKTEKASSFTDAKESGRRFFKKKKLRGRKKRDGAMVRSRGT